ncbi:hypothetical protein [Leifsonia sp. SIMBA_070]|uniref:hypothetical protein n=1 Tax=Leifsonia sp. SIMBA_070 TaxID=3085810 RepID=UPI00397D9E36
MTVQVLSATSTRRLARLLGEPTITRAWVDNERDHHVILFATWAHEHGRFDRRTGASTYEKGDDVTHAASCFAHDGSLLLDLEPFDDDGRWPTLRD